MSKKKTLTESVYNDIYEDIVNQRLRCGEKLTLDELSTRYGVSYSPIREALNRLKEVGLVDYYSNKGVYVVDFTVEDIENLYRFVSDMDALAVRYCMNIPNKQMLVFEAGEIIENCQRLLEEGSVDEWRGYSQNFHKLFYKYAKNSYLNESYDRLKPKIELLSLLYYQKEENVGEIHHEHIEIYEAIKINDFEDAAEKMRNHLLADTIKAIRAFEEYKGDII